MPGQRQRRILVIGETPEPDDLSNLEKAGFELDPVESAEEAAEKLASDSYWRLLSDSSILSALHAVHQESALRESEEMYRNLVERSNDGVAVLQDELVKFVNHRFEEMSGYSAETLIGTKFTDYLTPEEIAVLLERYKMRVSGEYVPSIYETTMTRRGGRKIPLEISAALVIFHGRPADLVLVRDITERKKAEEFLQRYRLLSESARDVILFVRLDGRVVEANNAAVDTYGYSHEELLSMSLVDLWGEDGLENIPRLMGRARRERVLFEVTHKRKDGTAIPVEVSLSTARVQEEPLLLAIVRDATERVRAAKELERSLRRATALESIAEAGLSILRLPDLLNRLVELIAKALNVDASCLFVLDEKSEEFEAHAAYNVPGLVGCRVKANEGLIGKVATEGRPIYVSDAENDPLAYDSCLMRSAAKALLAVPLISRGRVLGVTRIQSVTQREFTEDEVRLLQAMADRVTTAIDNARLYERLQQSRNDIQETLEREKHFSLLLQRALLPTHTSIGKDYDVRVGYVPVFVGREVGGDFYDVFNSGDGHAGVLIGDVSGKGLEAAALAATTRSTCARIRSRIPVCRGGACAHELRAERRAMGPRFFCHRVPGGDRFVHG